jgi:hypothetical protein
VATCRAAVESASCESLANTQLTGADEACANMIEGEGAQDEPCRGGLLNGGCRAGLACDLSDGTCPGTCQPEDSLMCVGLDCAEGEYCYTGECKPRAAAGAPCDLSSLEEPWERTCVDGHRCVLDGGGATTCVPSLAAGAPCDSLNPWECVDGNACIDGMCQAWRQIGAECATFSECAPPLTCDYGATPPVCAMPGGVGQACGGGVAACGPGLECVSGTCQGRTPDPLPDPEPLLPSGASCSGGGLCPLGETCRCDDAVTCPDMHCVPGPALGESCAPVMITDENGTFTVEDGLDPHFCREGICDFLGDYRCVDPQPPGGPCPFVQDTLTMACVTLVCRSQQCLGFEDLVCTG